MFKTFKKLKSIYQNEICNEVLFKFERIILFSIYNSNNISLISIVYYITSNAYL